MYVCVVFVFVFFFLVLSSRPELWASGEILIQFSSPMMAQKETLFNSNLKMQKLSTLGETSQRESENVPRLHDL